MTTQKPVLFQVYIRPCRPGDYTLSECTPINGFVCHRLSGPHVAFHMTPEIGALLQCNMGVSKRLDKWSCRSMNIQGNDSPVHLH
jgi:hypothetical protein